MGLNMKEKIRICHKLVHTHTAFFLLKTHYEEKAWHAPGQFYLRHVTLC